MPRNNKSARKIDRPHVFINFKLLGHKLGLNPIQRVKLAKYIKSVVEEGDSYDQ